MTRERQKPKRNASRLARLAGPALLLLALAPMGLVRVPAHAALTERIVVDWHTGLAIGGYDPVAFFTDHKPMAGSAGIELTHGDVVWRFCNIGNRAAFADRPDVYMPQYGGYDPVGVARGIAVAGNPNEWIVSGERLFLFYDAAAREKFIADPERVIAAALRKWPEVLKTLSP
jgi:hypothetical protein